jgi:CheY-like chemotaxis protein
VETPDTDLNLSGIRVLTVDDDPEARGLMTAILTQFGAEVLTVSSAYEVLALLDAFQPDVLVSDIGMPGIDGYGLIQEIRTCSFREGRLPAIALTAYAREEDQQRVLEEGFQQHLSKPIDPQDLVQAVIHCVSR